MYSEVTYCYITIHKEVTIATESKLRARLITSLVWLFTALGAFIMAVAGFTKFGDAGWGQTLDGWGFPGWLQVLIGTLQLVGAVVLFIPRLSSYAAALLATVMMGAAITETIVTEPQAGPVIPLVISLVFVGIFLIRRKSAVGPLSVQR